MHSSILSSHGHGLLLSTILLAAVGGGTCAAAEDDVRFAVQALAGTSGFEPGVAGEWRPEGIGSVIIRPEVFISENGRPGAGGAILYDITSHLELPSRQAFAIGPRAVYHDSHDSGWEVDAMATWAYGLGGDLRASRHSIGLIGAVGVLHDLKHDESDIGASAGLFYSYRF